MDYEIKQLQNKHNLFGISRKHHASKTLKTYNWDNIEAVIDKNNIDVVINLCGETIGQPWHQWSKKRIYNSRVLTTKTIVNAVKDKSIHLLNASGVGIYPCTNHLDNILYSESTSFSDKCGFLQTLSHDWEFAALKHHKTTLLRTAVVMKKNDGVLDKLMMGHQIKLLTQLGDGKNPFPWIAIEDWCKAVEFIIENQIQGPVNITTPELTNYNDIMNKLCNTLDTYKIKIPNFMVRSLLGEMGESLFLTGSAAIPTILQEKGFQFKFKDFSKIDI